MNLFSFNLKVIFFILLLNLNAFSEIVENIQINGNQRISNDTIKLFSKIDIGDEINKEDINRILKDLYETNFFENVFDVSNTLIGVKLRFLINLLASLSEAALINPSFFLPMESKAM